jgi:hypothetical protein
MHWKGYLRRSLALGSSDASLQLQGMEIADTDTSGNRVPVL